MYSVDVIYVCRYIKFLSLTTLARENAFSFSIKLLKKKNKKIKILNLIEIGTLVNVIITTKNV